MPSSYRAQPEIQDDLNGNNQVEAPIDAVRIATDILDAFLSAKTLEDKQLVYDNLARYTPDQLCRIEEELKTMKKIEMGKVDLLLLKLDILEGEILEMMPEYPVSKKIAVIINGDNIEDKHIENVKSAIKTLQGIGFDEIFVAHSGNLEEFQGIIQFDGTKSGVDKLFSQLDPSLQKDALVFLYTTGHGDGGAERESTIYLQGDNLRQSELLEYLKPIKNKGARLIASFDQCYSGNFPKAIINSGIEGIALSPGVEGVETACQFFAPYFFAALSEGRDMNNDGLTTIQEAFFAAMAIYNTSLGIQEHGEIARSTTELTEENYEKMMRSGKATVIEIGATWCGPCKLFAQEVHEVWGMVGEQVNFLTITMDQFPEESDSLIAKMKVEKPKRIPTVYITTDGGATFMPFVGRESSDIAMELKNVAGIEVNNDFLINKIHEAVPSKTREEITEMVEYGITSIDVIALMMNDFELFKKAMPSYSNPYFSTQDKAMLYLSKVSPETANGYAERFNIYVIAGFVGEGISPEQANGYAERFDVYDIVKLVKAGISNEEVLKYDKSFLSYDIVELVKAGISSEQANGYGQRFPGYGIVELVKAGISPEQANGYDKRFGVASIFELAKVGVSNEDALKYDKRFGGASIVKLVKAGISNEDALKYDKRFGGARILELVKAGISNEDALKYDKRFNGAEIVYLVEVGISSEQANGYDKRFSVASILELVKAGVSNEDALKYDKRFDGYDIVELAKAGISNEDALKYDKSFLSYDIVEFVEAGLSNEEVLKYDERFNSAEIVYLVEVGISPEQVNGYAERFDVYDIVKLVKAGISNEEVLKYDKSFLSYDIVELVKAGISSEQANGYGQRFPGYGIVELVKAGISFEQVNGYDEGLPISEIISLEKSRLDHVNDK